MLGRSNEGSTSESRRTKIKRDGSSPSVKSDQTNRGISVYSDNNYENPNPYFSGKYETDKKTFYKGYGINIYKNFIKDVFFHINKFPHLA